jgi:hypothetical protein
MNKLLLSLLLVSTVTLAETDNEYPVIDISDTNKFPPAVFMPSDYQWPEIEYDSKDLPYKQTHQIDSCLIDLLGGCRKKTIPTKITKYRCTLPKISETQRLKLIEHFNSTNIMKPMPKVEHTVNLKTNYHHN